MIDRESEKLRDELFAAPPGPKTKHGSLDYERALWKFCDNVRDGLDSDDEHEREISAGDRELLHELGLWRGPESLEFEPPSLPCPKCGSQRTAVAHRKGGYHARLFRYGCRTCDHFWKVTR